MSASQPLDQPVAVPGHRWIGWSRYPTNRCAWIPAGLFDRLSPAGPPDPDDTSCTLTLTAGTVVRITWGLPQSSALWHGTPRTSTVAGLETRITKPFVLELIFPGACRLDINTGITGLTIVTWNRNTAGNRCHVAETVASLAAHALVPRAGGTPWQATPQRPAPSALVGRGPCGMLSAGAALLDPLDHFADLSAAETEQLSISADDAGETCSVTDNGVRLQVGVTDTRAQPHDSSSSDRYIGVLAAHQENTAAGCTFTLEIVPGHQLVVFYRGHEGNNAVCAKTELVTAAIVQTALDRTTL